MNVRYRNIVIALVTGVLVCGLSSCKKKNDDTTKNYLSGYLRFSDAPAFASIDQKLNFHPYGVTHPKGNALGIYWNVTTVKPALDTLLYAAPTGSQPGPLKVLADGRYANLDHTFSFADIRTDTVGTFSINYTVYPIDNDQYYSSVYSVSVTFVDEKTSIPELSFSGSPAVYDAEGHGYTAASIAGDQWLARNLADATKGGVAYMKSEAVGFMLGRFYTWDEAVKACPAGYGLPTIAQCKALMPVGGNVGSLMVDARFNTTRMWPYWPEVNITNAAGMYLLPMGYCNTASDKFEGYQRYACFWSSDLVDGKPQYAYIACDENEIKTGSADRVSRAMPVRCVKLK